VSRTTLFIKILMNYPFAGTPYAATPAGFHKVLPTKLYSPLLALIPSDDQYLKRHIDALHALAIGLYFYIQFVQPRIQALHNAFTRSKVPTAANFSHCFHESNLPCGS